MMGGYVSTYGESMCEFSIACWNVVRKADACVCSVLQRMNYYPFGGMMASSTGGAVQPYRYTGKELVRFQGLDWLDYGARVLTGWTTVHGGMTPPHSVGMGWISWLRNTILSARMCIVWIIL